MTDEDEIRIMKLNSDDISKMTPDEVAELPISFWENISFEAINVVNANQISKLEFEKLNRITKIIYERFNYLKNNWKKEKEEYYSLDNRLRFRMTLIKDKTQTTL